MFCIIKIRHLCKQQKSQSIQQMHLSTMQISMKIFIVFPCDIAIWIESDTNNLDRWKFVGFATIAGRSWTSTLITENELNPFARLQV